jgi:hypothetical protein
MRAFVGLLASVTMLCAGCLLAETSRNLVANPGFEAGITSDALPARWTTYVPAEGPDIGVVDGEKHGGLTSARIRTDDDQKAYLVSDMVPVAPGETLALRVWCRTQDMTTTSGGSFGINCGFLDRNRRYLDVAKWQPLAARNGEWFEARSEALVPPRAAYATFQVGHRLMTGTSWWDDAELVTTTPLAVRFDLTENSIGVGITTVPLVLLNRSSDSTAQKVVVETEPGNMTRSYELSAAQETPVGAMFKVVRRGRAMLHATLMASDGRRLHAARQEVTVPPLLVTEPVLPVYFCVEDGKPGLEGRVWVNEAADRRSSLSLRCSLHAASGSTYSMAVANCIIPAPLPPNPVTFKLNAPGPLHRGDYKVRVQLNGDTGPVLVRELDWHITSRESSRVLINADGVLVAGGEPFFPIGMFDCKDFEEIARAGFNVTQNYDVGHVREGALPDNERMLRILDNSLKCGMKHLFLVCHGPGGRRLDEEHLRRVRMFRDHPAVICWYEEEGVARGDVTVDFVRDLYHTVKGIAPERPIVIGDSVDKITRVKDRSMFFPSDDLDIGIWWWYPIPIRKGGRPGAYEGEEDAQGLELVPPTFLTLAKMKKPIWVALQSYKKPTADGRFPTPIEYRAQAYLAIIHGAKGLIYYTGGGTGGVQNARQEGHWESLKAVVSELRDMSPVLVASDSPVSVTCSPSTAPVSLRVKNHAGEPVLLAANRSDQPADIEFKTPIVKDGQQVNVRFEGRRIRASEGGFRDTFTGYGVHVYDLPRGPDEKPR